ncbi:uncharacterized protein KQ657_000171 [Scheffersomyces spartinae]|uniref:Rab-GAP TBC domain-containing protein n=1 Tax=Scheffersomyces spartinae TaxID=45513 RepID=A0A9P8ALJ7_9ASCO|nr:uncharacterized protein KQ657_000171 [Scheffersomyces spartinae]KAG7196159.1 hypothetical protein KQ657_000171 [Scheffersomyces spartinae]
MNVKSNGGLLHGTPSITIAGGVANSDSTTPDKSEASLYPTPSFTHPDLSLSSQLCVNHQRNNSAYSANVSLIDIYGADSIIELSPKKAQETETPMNANILDSLDTEEGDTTDELSVQNKVSKSFSTNRTISTSSIIPPGSVKSSDYESEMKRMLLPYPMSISKVQDILNSEFDMYGFKKETSLHVISRQRYDSWFKDYSEYLNNRQKKWELLMRANGLSVRTGQIPTRFPPKSDKVKKMIRRGIPPEWRGNAWFFYAGGYEKLNKHTGIYAQIIEDTRGLNNKDTEVIERDLNRTFPDNILFNEMVVTKLSKTSSTSFTNVENESETPMIQSLRRVLVAFSYYQPQIGYCQSLNFLAGMLLLFMDEERAFWMLVILTERIIPNVHSKDLEGVHTDQGVLMLTVKEYIPSLWSILGRTYDGEILEKDKILTRLPPVTLVTSSWFMSLFVGILPIETTLRVWDILWYEGSKTVFRVSLTVCKMCLEDPDFQRTGSSSTMGVETEQIELFQFLQNYPKCLLDPNEVVDKCFKKIGGYGFGSISQDEINHCRDFVSKQRAKMKDRKLSALNAELTDEERSILLANSNFDNEIHDVYGFHRSIMSGVVWNRNISSKMKKKFSRKHSTD